MSDATLHKQQQQRQQQCSPLPTPQQLNTLLTGTANMATASSMLDLHAGDHNSEVAGCMGAGSPHCSHVGAQRIAMVPFWMLQSLWPAPHPWLPFDSMSGHVGDDLGSKK